MQSSHSTGFSTASAEAALADALGGISLSSKGAATVQVIVQGVTKVGNAWTASVLILTEPKIEVAIEKPELKPSMGRDLKKEKEEEEDDKRKKHDKELQLKMKQEFAAHHHLMETLESESKMQEQIRSLWMDVIFEPIFKPLEPQFNFTYVHYVESGSLWDAVLKHHPVLDMYEAAHDLKGAEINKELTFKLDSALEMKPEPKIKYANSLDDELF